MRVEKAPGLLEYPYMIHATEEEFQKIVKVVSENENQDCTIRVKEILLKQMALLQERSEQKSDLQDITEASRAMSALGQTYATITLPEIPGYIAAPGE